MNSKRIINTFILSTIGIIFCFDAVAYVLHNDTISKQVTGWLNQSTTNLAVFLAVCAVFIVHFVMGKYRD